jgi:hypothetical protein
VRTSAFLAPGARRPRCRADRPVRHARAESLVLRICAVLLAPTEDAFDHRPARLRHAVTLVPRGASVDGAAAALAGRGDAVVLRHMRRDVGGAQVGHMIGGIVGLVFACRDAGGLSRHGRRRSLFPTLITAFVAKIRSLIRTSRFGSRLGAP